MIAFIVVMALAAISLLHLAWAAGSLPVGSWAVPSVPVPAPGTGTVVRVPAFQPTRMDALGVAGALALLAALVAWRAGWFGPAPTSDALCWLLAAAALVFLARAVGDFKMLGFFQRETGSDFARMDRWLYSPLCVALACGLLRVSFA